MSQALRNKLAAQIIKADMLGDQDKKKKLEQELSALDRTNRDEDDTCSPRIDKNSPAPSRRDWRKPNHYGERSYRHSSGHHNSKVQKFLKTTGSLSAMFDEEKKLSASDEAKMFIKTSAKFSRDDMETKYFSSEIDDSQQILNKSKRHKQNHPTSSNNIQTSVQNGDCESCYRCKGKIPRHLIIHNMDQIFMATPNAKPFLSSLSNIYLSNIEHKSNSFVSSDIEAQNECEKYINSLRVMWKAKGYRCIIMETYFRDRRPGKSEVASCGNHFQIHCLPIKEKHYERARMCFKQALQDCEKEWSMNRKLLIADGRRIQRYLPKGLSYFWVCFDELTNGFGHVIENEREFSRFFGLEVLAGMLDKDFNPMRLDTNETYREAFDRCRDFKLEFLEYIDAS